jgi:hypothetical protein
MNARVLATLAVLATVVASPARAQDEVDGMMEPGMQDAVPAAKLKTVVLGLEGRRGVDAGLAEALTDIVQGVYARQPDRVVLGRKDLERVLGFEETKQAVGCTDESCLSEIASALDADRLISGSLDKIGTTYLFVLTELDARRLQPIGRTEHQFAVEEAGLIPAVRDATEAFLAHAEQKPEMNVMAADDIPAEEAEPGATEVPLLHWLLATGKVTAGTLAGLVGAALVGSGFIYINVDDNGDDRTAANPATTDDYVAAAVLCWAPGGVVCLGASACLAWGVVDFLFPPREPVAKTEARLLAPPPAPRTARRDTAHGAVMPH